jgi:hypothetical protein
MTKKLKSKTQREQERQLLDEYHKMVEALEPLYQLFLQWKQG